MFALSNFFKTSKQPYGLKESYSEDGLLQTVEANWDSRREGYRDGVVLVPIPARLIRTSVVPLSPSLEFKTIYEARTPGEEPRKKTVALVDHLPLAGSASVVLYRADVLAEDNDRSSFAEWEVITVLAHATDKPEPMNPGTLMSNHFHVDGGTSTKMSAEEFERSLRESFLFWRVHTLAVER